MATIKTALPGWLVEHNLRNPITRVTIAKLAGTHRALLETSTPDQSEAMEIARTMVAADDHITELQIAIRETIPVLERAGRMVLAVKLRKLVDG